MDAMEWRDVVVAGPPPNVTRRNCGNTTRIERVDVEDVAGTLDDRGEATVEIDVSRSSLVTPKSVRVSQMARMAGESIELRTIRDQPMIVGVRATDRKDIRSLATPSAVACSKLVIM